MKPSATEAEQRPAEAGQQADVPVDDLPSGSPQSNRSPALHKYRVEEDNRALIEAIGHPSRVLDVGCGIGQCSTGVAALDVRSSLLKSQPWN